MNQEVIEVTYQDLQNLSERVISLVSQITLVEKEKISLSTSINNQLGIDGDDWFDIQKKIQTDFNFNFNGFNFQDYFHEEGEQVLKLPFIAVDTIFRTVQFFFTIPFGPKAAMKVWKRKLPQRKPDLRVEDLITSILKKKFLLKHQVEFKLI